MDSAPELFQGHLIEVTPAKAGWLGRDVVSCVEPGSLRLLNPGLGAILLLALYSPNLTVGGAMDSLAGGPFASTEIAASVVGDRSGQRLRGTVNATVVEVDRLMPHIDLTEDVIDRALAGRNKSVEIHVLEEGSGVLTVAVLTDSPGSDDSRSEVMALVENIEVVLIGESSDSQC
jgi:hypothetical protein